MSRLGRMRARSGRVEEAERPVERLRDRREVLIPHERREVTGDAGHWQRGRGDEECARRARVGIASAAGDVEGTGEEPACLREFEDRLALEGG
eukprot:CAMPEP_0181202976 /NCGR_PEP_ID=MMETSP1096-20121128/19137_1 /TAXON_ID=156174 ORGANISM="Chrysochromulina ericina, Strain CCMP281" /NCGR_SAMPLE_ID=MMETSP1096 /ASSEMBLY_ACC=CAM_ASM_000453 /LENGTH=92 /DNA_ID=CAMNT_0023293541 /DNA_START=315 /DNA_END=593 /DNA_ORIENTATION=-